MPQLVDENTPSTLLRSLYSAVLTPELWEAFLADLARAAGANSAVLIEHNLNRREHGIIALSGTGLRASARPYEHLYFKFDEWTFRFPSDATLSGTIVLGQEIWPEASLRRSPFYNEFLKNFDICQMACLAKGVEPGVFDALSIFRGPGEGAFERERLTLLRAIAPHLRTALDMRRKLASLEARTSSLEGALDRLGSALVLVDVHGKIVFANAAAQRILSEGGLLIRNCRLAAEIASESACLQELLRRATETAIGKTGPAAGSVSIRRPRKQALQILVSPFLPQGQCAYRHAAAAVYISDPDGAPAIPDAVLSLRFRLTRAEIRLALAIFSGKTLTESAEINEVSRETVKSQLRSIFQKTGTRRQSELIRLLTSLSCFKLE